jgi:hypothetical protein
MIYDETLLPMLCKKHLVDQYIEGLHTLRTILTKKAGKQYDRNVREFEFCPLVLTYKLDCMYKEGKRRKVDLKGRVDPYTISDEVFIEGIQQMKRYIPMYTIPHQKDTILDQKCCHDWYFRG